MSQKWRPWLPRCESGHLSFQHTLQPDSLPMHWLPYQFQAIQSYFLTHYSCPHLPHMHTPFYYTDQLKTKKLCLCYNLPMIATMSANMWFLPSLSMAARCANPGAFILHLYGFELPSDTRYIPNSPVVTIKNQLWVSKAVIIGTEWTWRIHQPQLFKTILLHNINLT